MSEETNELTPEAGSGSATCETHGPLCPHPSRCAPAESNERYVIEIEPIAETVELHDTEANKIVQIFTGHNRLLAATTELNRLNAREVIASAWPGMREITRLNAQAPAAFLAETLPAVARRQRLEGHLAEVREIRESLATVVAEQTANLDRALALERKLMKALSAETRFGKSSAELDTPSAPLSATETAQNASGVDRSTPTVAGGAEKLQVLAERELSATETAQNAPEVLVDAQIAEGLQSAPEALDELFSPYGYGLSKPGPY